MNIFISYRRADSEVIAGRVFDRLVRYYDGDEIFKDVSSIKPGEAFPNALALALEKCEAMLVLIGDLWLNACGIDGRPRLHDPEDPVRAEVEAAIKKEILIIPLLTGSLRMPSKDELPESLRPLTNQQAIRVRPDPDFHRDMDHVIITLEATADGAEALPRGEIGSRLKLHLCATLFWLGYDLGQLLTFLSKERHRDRVLVSLRQVAHHTAALGVDSLPKKVPYMLHYASTDDYSEDDWEVTFALYFIPETMSERLARLIAGVEQRGDERHLNESEAARLSRGISELRDLLGTLMEAKKPRFRARS